MPVFEVQGPDGKTYEADAPDMQTAAASFAPPRSNVDALTDMAKNLYGSVYEPAAHFVTGMVAKPLSDIGGLAATAHDAITGDGRPGDPAGFKQSIQDALTYQPRTQGGQAAIDTAGSLMKPISAYTDWAGNFYSNALKSVGAPDSFTDAVKNGETEAAGQVMNLSGEIPGQAVAAAKQAAGNVLRSVEAKAAGRVKADVDAAQTVAPGLQTVAQTTGGARLAKLGQGAAGAKTTEASAQIIDRLAGGMKDQARAIAPLGVSNPEVAGQVQKVLKQKDADLDQRADAVYSSGRSRVAQDKGQVSTFNTVNAVDQMLAEGADPTNLSPPVVTKRLQGLADSLRAAPAIDAPRGTGLASIPAKPNGTNWAGFYDLRKQINTLYADVPRDAITPAMDQTFARLKAAYHADLDAAPAGPAKDTTVKANDIYAGIQDQREALKNSVVASILGKDGKTAISDPDQVMQGLYALKAKPAAQKYVRDMLEQYSPDTLRDLRSYVITKNVHDAGRTGQASTASTINPRDLTPGSLADSGLFTDAQATELRARESALRVALNALPEKGAPQGEIGPQEVGRLVGGMSPVFWAGAAAKVLSRGKLEKYLNTPEGRNALLAPSKVGSTAGPTQMFAAAVLARAAQERREAAQQVTPPRQ